MRLSEVAEKSRLDMLEQMLQVVLDAWHKQKKSYPFDRALEVERQLRSSIGPYAHIEMCQARKDFKAEVERLFSIAEDKIGSDNLFGFELHKLVFGPKEEPYGARLMLSDPSGPKTVGSQYG